MANLRLEADNLTHGTLLKMSQYLKGQSHEIFHLVFFSLNNSTWGPDTPPTIFSNFVSNSPSYSNLKFDSPLYNIAGNH